MTLEELASIWAPREKGQSPELAGRPEREQRKVFSPLCCKAGAMHGGEEEASRLGLGDTHRSNTRNMKLEDS